MVTQNHYNRAHSIVKINYALEILKLFCDDGAGEGLPINICILPDFVIDFDEEIQKAKYENKKKRLIDKAVIQIGGRAARIAKDLVYLRYADDGCFNINLLCKTDNVGYALLKKQLITNLDKKYHPLDLSNIHIGQKSRTTLREGQVVKETTPPDKENELSLNDLELYGTDTIKKSTIAMITSVKTPDFKKILEYICNKDKDNKQKKIIIDTSRCEKKEDWGKFITSFNSHRDCVSVVIFDKESINGIKKFINPETGQQDNIDSLSALAQKIYSELNVPILILYETFYIWIDKKNKIICPLPKDINFDELPDSTESFKAGFLLSFAVQSELERWKNTHKKNINIDVTSHWTIEITDVLVYAGLICGAWSELYNKNPETHPDKQFLLQYAFRAPEQSNIPNIKTGFYQLLHKKPNVNYWEKQTTTLKDIYNKIDNTFDKICFLESLKDLSEINENMDLLKTIAQGLVFNTDKKSEEKGNYKELDKKNDKIFQSISKINLLNNLRDKKENKKIIPNIFQLTKDNTKDDNEERRVVLIDLDSTLLDSAEVRVKLLTYSIKNICQFFFTEAKEGVEINKFTILCVDIYEKFIYDRWPFFLHPYINFGNFRQQWNLPHSYSMLIFILNIFSHLEKNEDLRNCFYDCFFYYLTKQKNDLLVELKKAEINSAKHNEINNKIIKIDNQILNEKKDIEKFLKEIKPVIIIPEFKDVTNFLIIIKDIQPDTKKEIIDQKIKNHEHLLFKLKKSISEIETKYSKEISITVQKFKESHFPPYKEAVDFIKNIRNIGDIEVYVATEGHHETQLLKLRQSGINNILPEEYVLSTGLVSTPSIDLENIKSLLDENKKLIDQKVKEIFKLKGTIDGIEKVRFNVDRPCCDETIKLQRTTKIQANKNLKNAHLELSKLSENKKMLNKYRSIFDKFSVKAQKAFFALSIYSIINNRNSPQEFLKTFSNIIFEERGRVGKEYPMKVIMIGDRHDYDIIPVLELFRKDVDEKSNITTIRIRTKKYMNKPNHGNEKGYPDYIVSTLEEAKCLLLNRKTWDDAPRIYYPVILDFPVTQWDDLNMIIWAKDRRDISSIISTQIIEENCNVNSTVFFDLIIKYLNFLFKENDDFNMTKEMNYNRYIGLFNVLTDATNYINRLNKEQSLDEKQTAKCEELSEILNKLFLLFYERNRANKSQINKNDYLQKMIVTSLNNINKPILIKKFYKLWYDDQKSFGINTCNEILKFI